MRAQLRPNAFLRLIENRWITGSESFVPMEDWDACVDEAASAMLVDPSLQVWLGIDASTKRDSTAIVACAYDAKAQRVRVAFHRIFQPSPDDPLNFEATIVQTVLDLKRRFWLREVRFDPYQMAAVSQRLTQAGVPMVEWPQTVGNITEASNNLFELIKSHNLSCYPNEDVRLAVSRAVAVESARGWKISKEKTSHRIDVVVAMAMAALGAIQGQSHEVPLTIDLMPAPRWTARWAPRASAPGVGGRGKFQLPPDTCDEADAREDSRGDATRFYHGSAYDLFQPTSSERRGRRIIL